MAMTATEIALGYHKQGLPVMPIRSDKRPIIKGWEKFAEGQTEEQLRQLFKKGADAIGFVLPKGWVAIDIDQKYEVSGRNLLKAVFQVFRDHDINPGIFPVQETPSGGWHILFRSPVVNGNKHLAQRPYTQSEMDQFNNAPGRKKKMEKPSDRHMAIIETREYGGQIAIYPTEGYRMLQKDIKDAPMLSEEDYHKIMDLCSMFDETIYPAAPKSIPGAQNVTGPDRGSSKYKITPIEDYIQKATGDQVIGMLQDHGYEIVFRNPAKVYFKRPGKSSSSKDYCGNYEVHRKVFYNFSPNSDFVKQDGFSPFAVLAVLQFGGNYSAAGKWVMDQGYGVLKDNVEPDLRSFTPPSNGLLDGLDADDTPQERKIDPFAQFRINDPAHSRDLAKRAAENTYQVGQPIEEPNWYWFYERKTGPGTVDRYDIAADGMMVCIVGPPKSRKSLLIASIVGAGLSNNNYLGWNIDFPGPVLFIDTEQPKYDNEPFCRKIESMSGSRKHDFIPVRMKGWHYKEVYHECIRLCEQIKPSVFILDNVRHLVRDYNDVDRTNTLMDMFSIIQAHLNITVVPVLHVNRQDGRSKGHTGAALDEQSNALISTTLIEPLDPKSPSKVMQIHGRQKRFPAFGFTHGPDGLPAPYDLREKGRQLLEKVI